MIRFIPIVLLVACDLGKTVYVEGGCAITVSYDDCPTGCASLAGDGYVLNAWQCGGSGTASQPGEADDCIDAYDSLQLDESGDQVCASCTSIDGDTGGDGPWTYLRFEIMRCDDVDTGAADASVSISIDTAQPEPPTTAEPTPGYADPDPEPMHPRQGQNHPTIR